MINKFKLIFMIDILQVILILLLLLIYQFFKVDLKIILEITYIVSYICCVYSVYLREKSINAYIIFISCNFLFIGSRTILDIFKFRNIGTMDKFMYYDLSDREVIFLLFILLSSQLLIQLGYDFIDLFYRNKKQLKITELNKLNKLNKLTMIILILLFPLIVQKKIIQVMYAREYGYKELYLEGIKYPFYLIGVTTLFNYFYFLFISTRPRFENFIKISILYFFTTLMDGVGGTRNKLFLFIFFFYTVYLEYNKRIKKVKIILFGGLSIILAQMLVLFRAKVRFKTSDIFNKVFIDFINEQGITVTVVGAMIHFKEKIIQTGNNFLLDPLNIFSSRVGNSIDRIMNSNSLAHHISFYLSPERYLKGEGTGGSFLAELLEYNICVYILLLLCLGMYINLLLRYKNNIYIYVVYIFSIMSLYFMGRGTYFLDWRIICQVFLSCVVIKIYFLINKGKK